MAADEQEQLTVEITSPGEGPITLEGTEIILPGRSGIFSVRPGHTPLLSTLNSGVMSLAQPDGSETHFAVHEGFAEVLDNTVRILTPQFERGEHIEVERAEEARERAEQLLARKEDDTDMRRAEAALHRAMARLGAHHGESI